MAFLDTNGLERFWQHIVAKIGTKADASDIAELQTEIDELADTKADAHTHPYAGSATQGGSATSAVKLDSSAGSATQPIYFENGKPKATTYTLGKSVPSDAKFTDTTYTLPAAGTDLGGVKSGGDVTISGGTITVNDDSHNHVISNVDGLQSKLDSLEDAIPTVDSSLSTSSTNPVQNKVVTNWLSQNVKDFALQEAYYYGDQNASDWYLTLASSGVSPTASEPSDGENEPQYGNRIRWIQTSDGKFHKITAAIDHSNEVIVSDTYGYLKGSGVQSYTLDYLKNVTSDIQSQLNAKSASNHKHSASDITSGTLGVARGGTGKTTHTSNAVLTGNGTSAINNVATASGAFYATSDNGAAQFGTLPIAQGGTGATSDSAARTNLGVYSKTEVDSKIDAIVGEGASETLDTIGEISAAIEGNQSMLTTLNNAVGGKQATITGGATTITSSNLTASRALVSDGNGKVAVSAVTSTELGYLDGVTSAIQSQLDSKSADGHKHSASDITSGTLAVGRGGTGLTSSPSMLVNLGSTSAVNVLAASPRPGITGTLGLGNGGTGATTAAAARTNLSVYSKAEVDEKVSIMTNDMIDAICGATIASASNEEF